MLQLSWIKCQGDVWCSLLKVNLEKVTATGVYVIWHAGDNPRTVRVGQGNIADRLSVHRNDENITQYSEHGLYVTWASVSAKQMDGVEAYLADILNPLEGERFPEVARIAVNSPFQKQR